MINKLISSAILLVFLGLLFSIPIVAKTFSAHGAVPALVTGLIVVALVFLGPIAFSFNSAIETQFFSAASSATNTQIILILMLGFCLFLAWLKSVARGTGYSIPYLTVTGWGLIGAYFCVLQIFTHIT